MSVPYHFMPRHSTKCQWCPKTIHGKKNSTFAFRVMGYTVCRACAISLSRRLVRIVEQSDAEKGDA